MTLPMRVLGVTGSRAEFGLLVSTLDAIAARRELELLVAVLGAHFLPPARTRDEVAARYPIAVEIPMQEAGTTRRLGDALAVARGVFGVASALDALRPDVVLVLGDRIEAFAAATAAAIAGVRVAHIHGGDRAEGVADESMRHAISKLAHVHFCATPTSAERLRRMGEDERRIHVVGSPAIDGLADIPPLSDAAYAALGSPEIVVALHPTGAPDEIEEARAIALISALRHRGRLFILEPNADPGRDGILRAIKASGLPSRAHLPRPEFVGLLRRVRLLAGNSSAGLIEAAALGVRVLNVGTRQVGRERAGNVVDCTSFEPAALAASLEGMVGRPPEGGGLPGSGLPGSGQTTARPELTTTGQTSAQSPGHPYGSGQTGAQIAEILAHADPSAYPVSKRNTY
ncbi:MAG: UDP-N-acetylglucosamine 2-epimerase (hydrolyzing) [Phycisphaerae bacterium]|nr:UDP-N-acetylglucosamine 2-epimerase (hydrolyzing) [Phycisphaerae bacterium]